MVAGGLTAALTLGGAGLGLAPALAADPVSYDVQYRCTLTPDVVGAFDLPVTASVTARRANGRTTVEVAGGTFAAGDLGIDADVRYTATVDGTVDGTAVQLKASGTLRVRKNQSVQLPTLVATTTAGGGSTLAFVPGKVVMQATIPILFTSVTGTLNCPVNGTAPTVTVPVEGGTPAPTPTPTVSTTPAPSVTPTPTTTAAPRPGRPTAEPTTTTVPTTAPTAAPAPSDTPSATTTPDLTPTAAPTAAPTSAPTTVPAAPTTAPTAGPTAGPTVVPPVGTPVPPVLHLPRMSAKLDRATQQVGKKRATVVVTLKPSRDGAIPAGKVKVTVGKRTVRTVTVTKKQARKAGSKGRTVKVTLPKNLKPGKHTVKVRVTWQRTKLFGSDEKKLSLRVKR